MKSLAELAAIKARMQNSVVIREGVAKTRVVVGMATCGIAAGARPVMAKFVDEIAKRNLANVKVTRTGCLGMCKLEPIVEVFVPNKEKVTYCHLYAEKAVNIVVNHLVNGNVCTEYLVNNEE